MTYDPAIELRDVHKRYAAVEALSGVDLAVGEGEVVALLGPNGAGKTTCMSLMLGLSRPSAGSVRMFGMDPRATAARTRCGAMLQESGLPELLTVAELVRLFRSYYPAALPQRRVLELAGLDDCGDRRFAQLSGGQRQRLYFGLAVCGDPEVLFLDEPTVGSRTPTSTSRGVADEMLIEQTRAELLRYVRSPFLSVFTIALPVILYLFVGLGPAGARTIAGIPGHTYLLAGLAAYGVANVMLSTFGIGLTLDRSRGMDILMRATPLRPAPSLLARAVVAMAFGGVALAVIGLFATVAGGVRLDLVTWAALAASILLGSLPFLALGLAIGYLVNPNAGAVAVNLIGLPLFFAAGVFRPLDQLPTFVQHAAPFLPTYRYAQLAWAAAGASGMAPLRQNVIFLAVFAAFFAFVAVRAYRRQEARRFA